MHRFTMGDYAPQQLEARKQMQARLEDMFPASIEIRGLTTTPVACAGGILRELGSDLSLGPILRENDLGFRVRKELLTDAPETNTRLTYGGSDWMIARVVNSPHDVAYIIGCNNISK